jgi:prefoldin alpha subunit
MSKEEILFKLSLIEQKSEEIKQHIEAVDNQINELEIIKSGLQRLDKHENKETLVSLGKGIFAKMRIEEKNAFVSVGRGVIVKKSFSETADVISAQAKEFEEMKGKLMYNLEHLNSELAGLVEEARKEK